MLEGLRKIAPVVAIKGNIDTKGSTSILPATAVAEAGRSRIWIVHDLNDLDFDPAAAGFAMVVFGHSHQPGRKIKSGVLHVNPGSAGPRRFRLPVTIAFAQLSASGWKITFVDLESGLLFDI